MEKCFFDSAQNRGERDKKTVALSSKNCDIRGYFRSTYFNQFGNDLLNGNIWLLPVA